MKKCILALGVCALVLAVTSAAVAQQDSTARRQGLQRMRETRRKAMADLEASVAELKLTGVYVCLDLVPGWTIIPSSDSNWTSITPLN